MNNKAADQGVHPHNLISIIIICCKNLILSNEAMSESDTRPSIKTDKPLALVYYISSNITVKPVLSGHSKKRIKIDLQDQLSLNAGQKYCRVLEESILQYF